jgi:hypothetical protein
MDLEEIGYVDDDDDDDAWICRTQNWDVWWVFVVAVMD